MVHPSRRMVLGAAASAAVSVALDKTACAQVPATRSQPIRIGCITALTGPQEVIGRPILNGAQIAADEINAAGGVLGRPLEIVEADAYANPQAAMRAHRDLTSRGINLLCGLVTSDVALAVASQLQAMNSVVISCSAQTEKLTHEAFTRNFFRVTDQTYMRNRAQARLMAERYPEVTSWGAIIPDTEYGHSARAAFADGLMAYYPQIAKRDATFAAPILADFGATDFREQIVKAKDSGIEGLFVAVYGGDAITLYRQARQAGLIKQAKVIADSYNEFLVPFELGSDVPEHLWLAMTWYYGGYPNLPMCQRLREDYLRSTGDGLPLGFVCSGYSAVYAYAAGLRKSGNTTTGAVVAALEGLTFDTPKGSITFRPEDHQAICDVNFVRMKSSTDGSSLDMREYLRADIEIAEFVRYDGASVIEPPTPGKPIAYRSSM